MTTPQDDILRTQFLHEQKQTGVWDLTKREWFAGMALQGIIAGCLVGNNAGFTVQGNVIAAYEYADSMIRAGKGE